MSQFIIQAKDYKDADALTRRMEARPFHLQRMKEEKEKGVFIIGGALLNENNLMIGSIIIVSLPDAATVKQWIEDDPYLKQNVWEEVNITPFRVAEV